ncbi:MAG: alpha/beta hydrolase [Clostridia bacterium]|nr:alpha/beta hydrolase [Clostridia bacterium]
MDERFNQDGLVLSEHYAETMENAVLPFLKAREKRCSVQGAGGKPLFCVSYDADAPKGTVLVLHGFTESAEKFSELMYSLVQNGFSVVAYDQRGHGHSWRDDAAKKDVSLTHVSDFNEYEQDLMGVCDAVLKKMPKPWMIFAHSMGGAVASLFLERHADVFSRAALCAPMIAAILGNIPALVVSGMCRCFKLFGMGSKRVFISKPYDGPEDFNTAFATGRERFEWYDKVKHAHREYWNNGPSYSWTLEAIKVSKWLLAPGAAEKIACPVKLYTANDDASVYPEPQKQFIGRVKQGEWAFVKGSKHEIYRSADDVLFPWWHDVLAFLKKGAE